jgi:glycerol-3-phosphate O-acyltransferase
VAEVATSTHHEPTPAAGRVVFLIDASSALERRLLRRWIDEQASSRDTACESIPIPPSRRRRRPAIDPRLEARLATGDDPLLTPIRVAWLPAQRDGVRAVRFSDLLTLGDPRDPGPLRQRWTLRRHADRCQVVVGEPAPVSELRRRWQQACGSDVAQTTGLAEFVARQAALALERAERRLRGARYKVPRFVYEDILSRPAFRGGLSRLAAEVGRPEDAVVRQAGGYLREIAATHSPYMIDLAANVIRLLYTRGYSESIRYDRRQLENVYALGQRHPLVFLPTHKSNLDHLVLQYVLYENGHPPNHTAGGINMNFFPIGQLFRRCGVFFIRRSFKDNPLYKFVLRNYVDYLIEKRFALEWYIEGGRSRSGKLLPPRFGLLAYVVDAYRRGKSEDVYLLPVSIAYDQIQDIGDYVSEQRGGAKEREGLGWFLRLARRLRRSHGEIHLRLGEPLSLARTIGPASPGAEPNPDERNLSVQKLAFEVAVRINRVTPMTPTSLVTLALLGCGDRALTAAEVEAALADLLDYVRLRRLPTTIDLESDVPGNVQRTLDKLIETGVVTSFTEGPEAVYAIGPDQHLAAAYYRNTIIHFFVTPAIAELSLVRAATAAPADPIAAFWQEAMELRDLLKFEFFFADKDAFRDELRRELAVYDAQWESLLARGPDEIYALLRRLRPFTAHRILRPFLEAYQVVADALARLGTQAFEEASFLSRCLAMGRQYQLQRRIRSAESVSRVLFSTALRLAANRDLLDPVAARVEERRRAFAREIRATIRRIDAIDALAASRQAGLIE